MGFFESIFGFLLSLLYGLGSLGEVVISSFFRSLWGFVFARGFSGMSLLCAFIVLLVFLVFFSGGS